MVVWQQQHIIRAIYVYPFSYRFTFVVRLLFAKFRFKYTPQPTMEQPQDIVVPFHHQPTIQDYIMLLPVESLDSFSDSFERKFLDMAK